MITKEIVVALVISGVIVGFINTLAAGGTVISMTLYMALGMPIIDASGTNRIAVILQNLVGSMTFKRENLLDMKVALRLSVPVVIGVLCGAQFSMYVSNRIFEILFAGGLIIIGLMIILKPSVWLKGREKGIAKFRWYHYLFLFLSGVYGGSVYVGLGYFLITIFVMGLGYDLIKANALKSFMAFATTPFSLIVFIMNGHVNYEWGIIHAMGNIVGSYFAARYSRNIGTSFIRYLLISVILLSLLDVFGVINMKGALLSLININK